MSMRWAALMAIAVLVLGGGAWRYFGAISSDEARPGVIIPTFSSSAERGGDMFQANCAVCHGVNAVGTNKGPPLIHKIYEPSHHGDQSFLAATQNGVRQHHWKFGNMPAVPGVSRESTLQIVAYIRELQRANGIN